MDECQLVAMVCSRISSPSIHSKKVGKGAY